MATRTENLVGKLSIHSAEWKAGLAAAASQFRSWSQGIARSAASGVGSISGMISGITGSIGEVAGALGLGGLLSAGGIVAGMKNIADLGGELSDVSVRTGIAVDDLMVLREQFRQGGVDVDSVTQYVRRMNEALMDAKKKDLWNALGLSPGKLLKAGPVDSLNAIISRVRELGKTAQQQKALSEIFGGRQGIQLMTLVADTSSAENAKKMLGSMPVTMAKNANALDAVSDNLFGGIGVKAQQFFAGFTTELLKPLTAAMNTVMNWDFTPVGKKIGAQLIWAVDIFRGLWANDDVWSYAWVSMKRLFMGGASYFAGVMGAAWNAVFSRENMMIMGNLFKAAGMYLAGSIQAAIPAMLGGSASEGTSKMDSAQMIMSNTAGLMNDMGQKTIQRFIEGVGDALSNYKSLPYFEQQMQQAAAESRGYITAAASKMGVQRNSPIQAWADFLPTSRGSWTDFLSKNADPTFRPYQDPNSIVIRGSTDPKALTPLSTGQVQQALKFLGDIAANTKLEID